jgi:hypothetical protein
VILVSVAALLSAFIGVNLSHDSNDDLTLYNPGELAAIGGLQQGETIGFPLPLMRNASAWPARIDGFRLDQVPAGTRLVGFRLLSVHDTHGILLGSFPTNHGCRNPVVAGYDCYPDYLPTHPIIPPGHISPYYAVFYLKLLRPQDEIGQAAGCEYLYTVEGVQHDQRTSCLYDVQNKLG